MLFEVRDKLGQHHFTLCLVLLPCFRAFVMQNKILPIFIFSVVFVIVLDLSLDSLMYPDLSPDEAGQNEMKLLYMNCPPEMRETLLHHTRGFAEELKELAKKLEAK